MLIAARFVQGVGGALSSAVILGMIVTMFPEPGEQAKAIGVFSFVASAGASIGLLAGGVLTQALDWHWIFFVNVPIGARRAGCSPRGCSSPRPGLGLARRRRRAGRRARDRRADARRLHDRRRALAGCSASSPSRCSAAFVWRQATAERPLLRLGILRSRNVAGANLVQMLMVAGMLGVFFLAVLYLQRVLGYDAVRTGAAFLPISLPSASLSLGFSARLNGRFGPRAVLLPALASIVAGLVLLARVPVDGRYVVDLLPAMLLLGIGGGLAFPALMTLAMSGVAPEDSGLASGLVNTTQQVGGALGLAVLATVASERTGGATSAAALVSGYHLAFAVAAAFVARRARRRGARAAPAPRAAEAAAAAEVAVAAG